jgi:hypothetical protein
MHADAIDTMEPAPRAGLGPTLLGGIVGAAVGIGLHVVLETGILGTQPVEASWFAVIIGLLTGLGVRQANKHHMERSYVRGAISGFIALGAIVLSTILISKVMARRDALSIGKPVAAAVETKQEAEDEGDDAAAAPAEPVAQPVADRGAAGPASPLGRRGPEKMNPWQFVFLALGALVAYEFGRGADPAKRAAAAAPEPVEPAPGATNPAD